MIQNDQLDTDTVTSELGDSPETEETDELDDSSEEGQEISEGTDQDEEADEPQKPVAKDYKQKFNSLMSNYKKLEREVELIKSQKAGEKISGDDLAKLKEKYEESDIEVIEKIINKKLTDHDQSALAQKEENIFLKKVPDITQAQLKHIKWMSSEFGYSLSHAYDITFGKDSPKKETPKNHSISGATGDSAASKKGGEPSDDQAYADMKKFYNA